MVLQSPGIAEKENLQLLRPLQYCRERKRETALTTTAPVLQRERNCNYCDPSSMANREKLQVLRPLQCCRDRETATTTAAPNQKLEGCKLGRIQSWKMCFNPTVGCWNLGCASSNFAAATIGKAGLQLWFSLVLLRPINPKPTPPRPAFNPKPLCQKQNPAHKPQCDHAGD